MARTAPLVSVVRPCPAAARAARTPTMTYTVPRAAKPARAMGSMREEAIM